MKKKHRTKKFQDLQYNQIISKERGEVEEVLRKLGILTPSLAEIPYSLRMSAQTALAQEKVDMASYHFAAPDFSHLKEKERIVAYYARPDVQREMYRYAQGRYVTVLRNFSPMFTALREPDDILLLMFHYLKPKGSRWPSMHGTISRYNAERKRVCDFVFEPDYKKSWSVAFSAARPIVKLFMSLGLPFFIKFSGNSSPHIIVPAEALTSSGDRQMKEHEFRQAVYTFVKSRMHKPGLLDGHTWQPDHFLRLPYSIHELGGRVSMPIRPEEFDSFNPDRACIETIQVIENWWHIPEDAAERGREFVQQVLMNYPRLVSGIGKPKVEHEWKAPTVPRKLRQVFDANWYAKVLANGQQLIELAAVGKEKLPLSLSAHVSKATAEALSMLEHWKSAGLRVDLKAAADVFDIDPIELEQQWGLQNSLGSDLDDPRMTDRRRYIDPVLDYYFRPAVQEALYNYADGRCFRVAGSKAHFRLQKASDVPMLMAFFRSSNPKWRGFECTRGIYDPVDNQITACDIGIEINFSRSDYVSAVELAEVLMAVLLKYEVLCFAKFDGDEILEIVIPAEALPSQVDGQPTALQMHQIASGLNRGFRRMPEVNGNDCALIIQPYGYTRPAYSLNPKTGLACVILIPEDLEGFSPEHAEIASASVNSSWLDIPDDAQLHAQRFLKYALSAKWLPGL